VNDYPILLIEVQSNPNGEDCYRMRTQAGVLVRVMNLIERKNQGSFVAMAVYITDSWKAERYFFYQPDRDSWEVRVTNILVLGLHSSSLLAD
jgi:capsid protein